MLFGDAIPIPTGEHAVTLGTLGALMTGIVAWILRSALPALIKQHRDDVFQLHGECREERAEDRDRYERELAKRDEWLEQMMETVRQLVSAREPQPVDPPAKP